MTLSKTLQILKAAEDSYCESQFDFLDSLAEKWPQHLSKILDAGKHNLIYPIIMIGRGYEQIFRSFFRLLIWALISYSIIFYIFGSKSHLSTVQLQARDFYLNIANFFAIVMALLLPPSLYLQSITPNRSYKILKQKVSNIKISSASEIDVIKENLTSLEERIKSRIVKLNAVIALIWGGFALVAGKILDFTLKGEMKYLSENFGSGIIFLTLMAIAFFLVDGYTKSRVAIFKIAIFVLNDMKVDILEKNKPPKPSLNWRQYRKTVSHK